jgi:hypothetical protein
MCVYRRAWTLTRTSAGHRGSGPPASGRAATAYRPGARRTSKRPSVDVRTLATVCWSERRYTRTRAATARGAHCGLGGMVSTGQVGAAVTRPRSPVSPEPAAGAAAASASNTTALMRRAHTSTKDMRDVPVSALLADDPRGPPAATSHRPHRPSLSGTRPRPPALPLLLQSSGLVIAVSVVHGYGESGGLWRSTASRMWCSGSIALGSA